MAEQPRFITLAVRVRYLESDMDVCGQPCAGCPPTSRKLLADEVKSNLESLGHSIEARVTVLTETNPATGNALVQSVTYEQEGEMDRVEEPYMEASLWLYVRKGGGLDDMFKLRW